MKSLGLIGDVHGELEALGAALAWFDRAGVEHVLCVGDIADGFGDVNGCCALLAERGVLTVRGNHDRWLLDDRLRDLPDATPRASLTPASLRFLLSLPRTRELETPLGKLLLCHGLGPDDMTGLGPDDDGYALETNHALAELLAAGVYRVVVAGHTHQRMVRRIGSITFLNPGTLHRDYDPCCARIDFSTETARVHFASIRTHDELAGADRIVDAGERLLP